MNPMKMSPILMNRKQTRRRRRRTPSSNPWSRDRRRSSRVPGPGTLHRRSKTNTITGQVRTVLQARADAALRGERFPQNRAWAMILN